MKSANAAISKQANIERQRARVRWLIEQNGFSAPSEAFPPPPLQAAEIPDNIIPFPALGKTPTAS